MCAGTSDCACGCDGQAAFPANASTALNYHFGMLLGVEDLKAWLGATLPDGPCWVQADPRALEQVLVNLLSNAIKYNRSGGAVRFELHLTAGQAAITIHKPGIEPGQPIDCEVFPRLWPR